jgi:hypothetical protein
MLMRGRGLIRGSGRFGGGFLERGLAEGFSANVDNANVRFRPKADLLKAPISASLLSERRRLYYKNLPGILVHEFHGHAVLVFLD